MSADTASAEPIPPADLGSTGVAARAESDASAANNLVPEPDAGSDTSTATPADGFGTPPAKPIATLPPLEPSTHGVAISAHTGEPIRTKTIVGVQAVFWLSAVTAVVGYALYWFHAMHKGQFHTASWVTGWLHPRPGGFWSIVLVLVLAVAIALLAAIPCITAYRAWVGQRFSRKFAWFSLGASALGVLFNWWSLTAILFALVGVVLLRLPSVSAYFERWEQFRIPESTHNNPEHVFYGPLPRFHNPDAETSPIPA